MVWIFALAATFLLLFAPRRVRKIGFVVWGTLLTVLIVIVLANRRPVAPIAIATPLAVDTTQHGSKKFDFDAYERDKKDREDPAAKTRIAPSEVRFGSVTSVAGVGGSIESVRVRAFNDSTRHTLTDVMYYLRVQDCTPAHASSVDQCTTVFDQHGSVNVTVPPGQARDVVIVIGTDAQHSPVFKLAGRPHVEIEVTDTRAYAAAATQ